MRRARRESQPLLSLMFEAIITVPEFDTRSDVANVSLLYQNQREDAEVCVWDYPGNRPL